MNQTTMIVQQQQGFQQGMVPMQPMQPQMIAQPVAGQYVTMQ